MELRRLEPHDPEAPWKPVLDADQVRVLAAIAADPMAPLQWMRGPNAQRTLAYTLAGLGLVRHPPGKRAMRDPWSLTERGRAALDSVPSRPSILDQRPQSATSDTRGEP